MTDRGHLNTASGYAEDRVLESLEFLNKGCWGVGEPNGSCIHEKGPDNGDIGENYGFLLLTPVGTSMGLNDIDTGWGLVDYRFDIGIEFEVRVKTNCLNYVSVLGKQTLSYQACGYKKDTFSI